MKKKIIIAGIVAAVLLIGGGLWYFLGRDSQKSGEDVVFVSKITTIQNQGSLGLPNRFSGVVEPQRTYEVQLQQEKTVKEVLVKEGQEVFAGTPLFIYDTEKMQTDLSQAELDMDRIGNDIDNLYSQIKTLEKEKKSAGDDEKLNYTTQIQTAKTDIKRNEYEQKSKKIEIEKLKDSIHNSSISSEIAGVVKSINENGSQSQGGYGGDGGSNAFITILETGQFRIKGTVNEQNMSAIMEGSPVIIRSRVNEQTWKGTLGKVDTESGQANNNNAMRYGGGSSSEESQSSSYPFYVALEAADGLMLGQHVYIEMDMGQDEEKAGVWLSEYMISDIDSNPYVWADDGKGKLVKKSVILGQHDADLMEYEIADGLTQEDAITFPEDSLEEGMKTEITSDGSMGNQSPPDMEGTEELDPGMTDEIDMSTDGMVLDGDGIDIGAEDAAVGGADSADSITVIQGSDTEGAE